MTKLTAIVAAGGFASRMGITKPKPMLSVKGKTLLEYTLNSLKLACVRRILVFNNREEFHQDQKDIINKFDGVKLIFCDEINSTIELLHLTRNTNQSDKYLFCYGNAPRTSLVYKNIIECNKCLAAICLKQSSRRDLIKNKNFFIEPPFLVNESKISSFHQSKLWSDLFFTFRDSTFFYHIDGPPEFNTEVEWNNYKRYIHDNLAGTTKPKSIKMASEPEHFFGGLRSAVQFG